MVYVDDMHKTPIGNFRGMKMSHMIADSHKELVDMAKKIGMNLKWIQHEGRYDEHFDICMAKRKLAIKYGAKEITYRQLGEMVVGRNKKLVMGIVNPLRSLQ